MTKIDIYSGFLGAGKTTLIQKMIAQGYGGQKLVLIENELGEIAIDGGFLQDAGINITEMSSGCICCSLVGDFRKALEQVIDQFHPDRVIIEPSGVGKLSDVIAAVGKLERDDVSLGYTVAVADAGKVKVYMKNFGEFYNNQIETASTILLSRTDAIPQAKLDAAVALLREHNASATIVTTPWSELSGQQILEAMDGKASIAAELAQMEMDRIAAEENVHEHHHHHHGEHGHEEGCCHHHDHDHEHEESCCHHHDHGHEHEEGCCHHHDHDHAHDEHGEGCCHHHDHKHEHGAGCCHHHHDADEVFTTWGVETPKKFTCEKIEACLKALDSGKYGTILRAKGIVPAENGTWIHFDYVPEEVNVRNGSAEVTGKICVIGSVLNQDALAELFGV